jgi:predicted dehydrogenase
MKKRVVPRRLSRRGLLKTALSASVFSIVPSRVMGADAPSKRITLGCIGVGIHGRGYNLASFLGQSDAQVVAVCDVFGSKRDAAQQLVHQRYQNTDCKAYTDFRRILEDPSIDAVVISTPDHWHVPMSLMAMEAGKDVFCEKPTHCIAEGRTLIEAVERHKAVFQVGLEDRSVPHYYKMIEWLRNGAIGDLQRVEAQLPAGRVLPQQPETAVPEDLDYNLFVGPAQMIPFRPAFVESNGWRFVSHFGSGTLVDWGAHQVDTAQLAASAPEVCPVEVEGTGEFPSDSPTDVPVNFELNYRYSNGVVVNVKSGGTGLRLIGSKGWVGNDKWRDRLQASDEKILQTKYEPQNNRHWPMPPSEHRNFLDCVKSRQPTTYTAQTMHHLHTTLHMGLLAIRLGRKLQWNQAREEFVNDAQANAMRSRSYRDWQGA